jgi:uncharacterized protein YlxP (DUF503 family)
MQVATLQLNLFLRQAQCLKDKRRVIKSFKDKVRNRFNVSVAEIDGQDRIQTAILGIAAVGNEKRHLQSTLDHIINFAGSLPGVELAGCEQDIFY